jgi:hypothetical protein
VAWKVGGSQQSCVSQKVREENVLKKTVYMANGVDISKKWGRIRNVHCSFNDMKVVFKCF